MTGAVFVRRRSISRREQERRMRRWLRYAVRNDALVRGQVLTHDIRHPIRTNPGFFRAEGWSTGARDELRHGG